MSDTQDAALTLAFPYVKHVMHIKKRQNLSYTIRTLKWKWPGGHHRMILAKRKDSKRKTGQEDEDEVSLR